MTLFEYGKSVLEAWNNFIEALLYNSPMGETCKEDCGKEQTMNKDIIYREDAIKAVENVSENYTKEGDREWHPHIDFITQALVEVPSVPSADRPQGEWIMHFDDIWPEESSMECSVCHEEQPLGIDDNFCPNCGARMKGADDD